MNEEKIYTVEAVKINEIIERPGLRNAGDDLDSLQKSIRELGLLAPLLVNTSNVLIAGYRRLEACRRLNWVTVPVIRFDVDENSLQALDILIQENLCRRDLDAEELEALIGRKKDLLGRSCWTNPFTKLLDRLRKKKPAPGGGR